MRFALILSLLIAIVAVVFAMYNLEPTEVNLVYDTARAPLALVIIISLLGGVLLGILASMPSVMKRGAEVRRLRKRVEEPEGGHAPAATREERRAEPPPPSPPGREEPDAAVGAAETQRLAAETQRMAAEAQKRAAEIERREKESRR